MNRVRAAVVVTAIGSVLLTGCSSQAGQPEIGPVGTSASVSSGPATSDDPTADGAVDWRSLQVTVATGSVPPPHNHVWWIDIDPANPEASTLSWRTNYSEDDQEWTTTFTAVPQALPALYELAAGIDGTEYADGDLVGGGSYGLKIVKSDGTEDITMLGDSEESADAGSQLKDAARAVIPDADFEELEAQYDEWAAAYE